FGPTAGPAKRTRRDLVTPASRPETPARRYAPARLRTRRMRGPEEGSNGPRTSFCPPRRFMIGDLTHLAAGVLLENSDRRRRGRPRQALRRRHRREPGSRRPRASRASGCCTAGRDSDRGRLRVVGRSPGPRPLYAAAFPPSEIDVADDSNAQVPVVLRLPGEPVKSTLSRRLPKSKTQDIQDIWNSGF